MIKDHNHMKEIKNRKNEKKFDENGKKIRNNRNPDGSRKKYIRKDVNIMEHNNLIALHFK